MQLFEGLCGGLQWAVVSRPGIDPLSLAQEEPVFFGSDTNLKNATSGFPHVGLLGSAAENES